MILLHFQGEDFEELEYLFSRTKNKKSKAIYADLFPSNICEKIHELHLKAYFVRKTFNLIYYAVSEKSILDLLHNYKEDLRAAFSKSYEVGPFIISLENKELLLYTEVYFFELKSFLDILAQIIGKYLEIKNGIHTFGTKNKNNAGGLFISILRANTKNCYKGLADEIIEIFLKYKPIWIDDCVLHRTTATHYCTLKTKITLLSPSFDPPVNQIKTETYFGDTLYTDYLNKIMDGFRNFLKEIINLLKTDFEYKNR